MLGNLWRTSSLNSPGKPGVKLDVAVEWTSNCCFLMLIKLGGLKVRLKRSAGRDDSGLGRANRLGNEAFESGCLGLSPCS